MTWSNEEKQIIEKYRNLLEVDSDKAIDELLDEEDPDIAVKIVLSLCLIQGRAILLSKDDFTDLREVSVKNKTTGELWLLYNVEDVITENELGQLKDRFFEDLENYYMFDKTTAGKIADLAVKG